MFGILFKAQVKAEKRQAFIDFIKWDIQVAKEREPGTLRFDLYQDPADENAFFVYEAYRDKKAFEEHKKNLPYQRWESQIRPEVVADFQPLFDGDAVCSVEMEETIMPNGEILKKITGDVADEASEATYRVAASLLVNAVKAQAIKRLGAGNPIKDFLKKNKELGEAVIGYALGAVLELSPLSNIDDSRKQLAHHCRVGAIMELEKGLLNKAPFILLIDDEVERALRLAKGEREPDVQPMHDGRKAPVKGARHAKAARARG